MQPTTCPRRDHLLEHRLLRRTARARVIDHRPGQLELAATDQAGDGARARQQRRVPGPPPAQRQPDGEPGAGDGRCPPAHQRRGQRRDDGQRGEEQGSCRTGIGREDPEHQAGERRREREAARHRIVARSADRD